MKRIMKQLARRVDAITSRAGRTPAERAVLAVRRLTRAEMFQEAHAVFVASGSPIAEAAAAISPEPDAEMGEDLQALRSFELWLHGGSLTSAADLIVRGGTDEFRGLRLVAIRQSLIVPPDEEEQRVFGEALCDIVTRHDVAVSTAIGAVGVAVHLAQNGELAR